MPETKISDLKPRKKKPPKISKKNTRKKTKPKNIEKKQKPEQTEIALLPLDSENAHDLAVDLILGISYSNYKDPKTGEMYVGTADGVVRRVPDGLKKSKQHGGQPGNNNAEKWTEEVALALAADMLEWLNADEMNIFYSRFLVQFKNVHPQIISVLTKKYSSFRKVMQMANKIKEYKLWSGGVKGDLNPGMTGFCLKNHHGASDKLDQILTGADGGPLQKEIKVTFVDAKPAQKKVSTKKKPKGKKKK